MNAALAFAAGAAIWFVPLVVMSGGPSAYWHALSNQGAEDIGNISMLWTTHNVRAIEDALYFAFVAPWATWTVAAVMLVLAAAGLLVLVVRDRRALALVAAAFGPYLVFDLLFQETFTGRYALPLVVPMAILAAGALRALPKSSGLAAALVVVMFDAHVGGTSIAAFSHVKAPAFRLLDDMARAAARGAQPPVLAMDRRNSFDFRRPIVWVGGSMPAIARQLPAPPQHEWLEAVKYWSAGGTAPVWFVVDPKRAAIDLVQHGDRQRYRWTLPYPELVSGARPDEMDWYIVDRPEWFVGEGWSLTPEAAGVAEADHRGLAYGPVKGWIHPDDRMMVIGGRNFEPSVRPRLSISIAGTRVLYETELRPGPFLLGVGPGELVWNDRRSYLPIDITTTPPGRVALEQFDASAERPLWGYGDGWHESELNPRSGLRWRWLSERGELHLFPRRGQVTLHLEGESPLKYFDRPSRLKILWRQQVLLDRVIDSDFSIDVPLGDITAVQTAPPPEIVTLETDQSYVPAERSRRTQDRRRLGLRIFNVRVSAQDTAASSLPVR